jgi:hypothetical protein
LQHGGGQLDAVTVDHTLGGGERWGSFCWGPNPSCSNDKPQHEPVVKQGMWSVVNNSLVKHGILHRDEILQDRSLIYTEY